MNELLRVNYDSDRITLSARELHEFLEIETPFKKWFLRMTEYGFNQNFDYREVMDKNVQNPKGGRPSTDYEITLDMAKEIAMIQRSEKGKQIRQYFLELERKWNSPEAVMNRALEYSRKQVQALLQTNEKLELENKMKDQQLNELKPKVVFADAVATSHTSILVGELAKILKQNGIEMGQKRLFAWLREKGYLIKRQGTDYNMPTQKAMDLGLFEIKEGSYVNGSGVNITTKTPKVTGKGQQYFINKFLQ